MAEVIRVGEFPMQYFDAEKSYFALLIADQFLSASVCEIKGGVLQGRHYHQRPRDGDEAMIVFHGAFRVVTDSGSTTHDVCRDGPVFILVKSGESVQLCNLSEDDPVRFFVILVPPFEPGELHFP